MKVHEATSVYQVVISILRMIFKRSAFKHNNLGQSFLDMAQQYLNLRKTLPLDRDARKALSENFHPTWKVLALYLQTFVDEVASADVIRAGNYDDLQAPRVTIPGRAVLFALLTFRPEHARPIEVLAQALKWARMLKVESQDLLQMTSELPLAFRYDIADDVEAASGLRIISDDDERVVEFDRCQVGSGSLSEVHDWQGDGYDVIATRPPAKKRRKPPGEPGEETPPDPEDDERDKR